MNNDERNMTVMDYQTLRVDGRVLPRDVWRSEAASCTPEERAFLDALKTGKSLAWAQGEANLAWCRSNPAPLAALRELAAQRSRLYTAWSAAWDALDLPFRLAGWHGPADEIYDYCSGARDTLPADSSNVSRAAE